MNRSWRIVTVALLALSCPTLAAAQTYRWTDDDGRTNYTQGIHSVPERHRANARLIGGEASTPVDATASTPAATSSPAAPAAPAAARAASGPPTRITFVPGQPIMVSARINGSGAAQLMLDTGAQVTVINPRALAAFGVSMRDAQRGTLQGVTGSTDTLAVRLESLEVSTARVGPLMVVSHDSGPGTGDGLLGRDFLDRFTVNIDNTAGVVTLTPK
jgi:hypothetical protein